MSKLSSPARIARERSDHERDAHTANDNRVPAEVSREYDDGNPATIAVHGAAGRPATGRRPRSEPARAVPAAKRAARLPDVEYDDGNPATIAP